MYLGEINEITYKNLLLGIAGITLNINWYQGKDDQIVNADAAERAMQFLGGWFANPIYGSGDYPSIMRLKVYSRIYDLSWEFNNHIFHSKCRLERRVNCKALTSRVCRNLLLIRRSWCRGLPTFLDSITTLAH